jgi:hypothetical protein
MPSAVSVRDFDPPAYRQLFESAFRAIFSNRQRREPGTLNAKIPNCEISIFETTGKPGGTIQRV